MISIVLPTYNEKECIIQLINECIKYTEDLEEVIVVDDNSSDGTWELVSNMQNNKVRVIKRTNKRSLPASILRGIKESKGDILIWMDSDFSHHPKYIPRLLEALTNADIAVASRYVKGGRDLRPYDRVFTSLLINKLASLLFFTETRDYTSGFVAVKKKVFDKISINTKGYGEYFIEFTFDAMHKNFSIKEVAYDFTDRKYGTSKTSQGIFSFSMMRHGIFYILKILTVRLKNL